MRTANETYVAIIIFLLILLIVLFIPYYGTSVLDENSYGHWRFTRGNCDNGTRTNIYECIPNPLTQRGCLPLDSTDKNQTFDIQVVKENCVNQINSSIWQLVDTQECQLDPLSPFPDTPTVKSTFQCNKTSFPSGINACEYLGFAFYGGAFGNGEIPTWTVANVGDQYSTYASCTLPGEDDYSGNWVIITPGTYNQGPLNTLIPEDQVSYQVTTPDQQIYLTRSECVINPENTIFDSLKEGIMDNPVACLSDNYVYIPEDQEVPEAPPINGFKGCLTYQEEPNREIACRYIPLQFP